jgi:hypothetical protein
VPGVAVSVEPTTAVPETAGAACETGAAGTTVAVRPLCADAEPPAFVAVTTTRSAKPTSAAPSV